MKIDKDNANPYAPPQAKNWQANTGLGCWRDGNILVVPTGEALPDRCVKCNAPAVKDKPRAFTWHHPGWYLLLLLYVIGYVIVGLLVRKKVKIAIGICDAHRRRRRILHYCGLGLFLFGSAAIYCAAHFEYAPIGLVGAVALLVSVIVAVIAGPLLSVARIDADEARFRGCGEAFLKSLRQR